MLKYFLVALIVFIHIFPIIWLALMSIKTNAQAIQIPPIWIFQPDWSHYFEIFFSDKFSLRLAMTNSVIISSISTAMVLLLAFPAAYSISRFKTGGKNLAFWILSFRILPPVIFMIPMFILYLRLNLVDTHIGLAFLYLTFNIPLAVWILKSFIDELPRDFEEAALVDGCSEFGIIWRIVLPLTRPGIVAVAILCFFFSFNEFFFAYVFTSYKAITMTVMASIFITQYTWLWADLAASMIITMIPMVVFLMLIQRELIRGLTLGAVKA